MKFHNRHWLVTATVLFSVMGAEAAEINKWVDENGTVHFSDRAPKDKKLKVEKVENKQAPKLGLSTEELSEQKRRTIKYQNEIKTQQYKSKQSKPTPKKTTKPKNLKIDREQGLILCRNAYPNNTKLRTQCFKQINKQNAP